MAADQERADRIRQLKRDNPQLKWRHIADFVGVELRSAQMWQETGAISYENAKKLAELVDDPEYSVEWIMRGPRTPSAPNPFAGRDSLADDLAALNAKLDLVITTQNGLVDAVVEMKARTEHLPTVETLDSLLEGIDEVRKALIEVGKAPARTRSKAR